jgi:hypothetical protein
MEGSKFEDSLIFIRPIHHFYDPINGDALLPILAKPSPDWALEDKGPISFPLFQRYSFADGRDYFYRALTASTPDDHDLYFGKTFETIGHVIHHIQDMAQPQHARLDPHLKLSDADKPDWVFENGSRYEAYTKGLGGNLPFNIYPPVNNEKDTNFFTTARSFWHTAQGGGMGLAEFTNTNFVSAGTNFRGAYQNGGIIARPNERYSLPAPSPITPSFELANNLLGQATPPECTAPNNPCVIAFFITEVTDNYRPQPGLINPKASTASIFDQDLQLYGKTVSYPNLDKCTDPSNPDTCEKIETGQIFSLNSFNFDAAHEFLIPRAVAYSAGLIDYFFRGKLEAEDVTFTDTGISLRVKNAIDLQKTPAWANEILYAKASNGSAGSLVVAFEYQDSTGKTQYSVSNTVPVHATDTLAPGRVSADVYDFTLTVPSEAKNVNYRLIFRGKLGQEEDAVVVGKVEPISGFVVLPNYLPTDGISGTRAIFKQGSAWKLSDKKGLEAGNIDWKGWYVNSKPTKVLTWLGPRSRYFPDASGHRVWSDVVYKDGEVFAYTRGFLVGAALMKDSSGNEWLIAICTDFSNDVVYRRPNRKMEIIDPESGEILDDWEEIGRHPVGQLPDVPWFFNGDGTEAQTMRRIDSANPKKRIRLKLNIVDGSTIFSDMGNLSGLTEAHTNSCEMPTIRPPQTDYEFRSMDEITRNGSYVVAVDYINNQEIKAIYEESYRRFQNSTRIIKYDPTNFRVLVDDSSGYGIENRNITLRFDQNNLILHETERNSVSTISGCTASVNSRYHDIERRPVFVDLRHNLLVTNEYRLDTSEVATPAGCINNNTDLAMNAHFETEEETNNHLKFGNQDVFISREAKTSASDVLIIGNSRFNCVGNPGSEATTIFPQIAVAPIAGAWRVDTSNNLFVSQEYRDLIGFRHWFNHLTGGDLNQLIPPGGTDVYYYPIGVIK